MKKKTLFILSVAIVLAWIVTAPPVQAGSPQQYRWQGVAIGVGASVIGSMLYHHARPPRHYVRPACPPRYSRGHWEWRRTWVPPAYAKTWNPGHYNRRKHWVAGRWIRIETRPGHWRKEKVRVPY